MTIVASSIAVAQKSTVVRQGRLAARSIISFTKGDVTAILAGDVISDSSSVAKALEFKNCAARKGGSGVLRNAFIGLDVNPGGTQNYGLILFDAEPTGFLDGQIYSLPEADWPNLVGHVTLKNADSTAFSGTAIIQRASLGNGLPFVCADGDTSLYGILTTNDAGTFGTADKIVLGIALEQDA